MSDQQLDIIFAMPHPDDVEITCGGTIAKLVKLGHQVGIVYLTSCGRPSAPRRRRFWASRTGRRCRCRTVN